MSLQNGQVTRRQVLAGAIGVAAMVLAGCGGSTAAPATPAASAASGGSDWQATWSAWQAAAKKEGTVVVFGPPTPKLREALPAAVKSKLGLELKYTGQDGGAFVSKLATERAAGTYSTDVVVAGAGSMFQGLASNGKVENGVMGMLAPLKPKLLLPEILDPSKYQGNKLWFVDPPGQYVLRTSNFTASTVAVNTTVVKPTDIQRWTDLLNPAYTGKIVAYDPTVAGAAIAPTTQLWKAYGQDFLKKLFVDQQTFISRDHRQSADQLGNGSRPVSLFLQSQALVSAAAQGLPVVGLSHMADLPTQVSGGFGFLGLLDHAPHPNAAAVFINWMLSREGQQLWQDAQQEASTRLDLKTDGYPAWYKDTVPKAGEQYFDIHDWNFILTDEPVVQKAMQEMLGRH